ncbi:MAG: S-layer homology domain-containing protein, partial [Syntrophomonadaceae bacterium]
SLVGNRSVSSGGVAGIRWWEINNATGGTPSFVQQSTYQPDSTWRWMGSAAMDATGNLALGFSASSSSIHPEIRYAGRLVGDPAGTLGQGEATLIAGTGSQTGTGNRWGDYSDLTVDPVDDCTFWFTSEYYAATGSFSWSTRIGNFKFSNCVSGPSGTLQGQVTVCGSGLPLAGALVSTGVYQAITDAGGNYSFSLPPGDYAITITKAGYAPGGGPATITDGGTTILNDCLDGIPVISGAGASLSAEDCLPVNGAPDPGETVTFSFCVQNTGGAGTSDLVATLQPTGGVTSPSGPQDYGAVPPLGGMVCRDFTFTVDPNTICGATVTATLALQDGATDMGTVAFDMTAGLLATAISENFDGVSAPALPAGWTAANAQGPAPLWFTSATSPDSPPNDAFVDDPSVISDKRLDSPTVPIATASAQLTFRNSYDLENTYDGGVLEMSIAGGAFQDVLAAGGAFVSGGYNGTISTAFSSPIAGRQAWTGNSSGYVTTVVTLPAAAAGQNVVLRWRMASDVSVSATGWRIDGITLADGHVCCSSPTAVFLHVDEHPALGPSALGVNGVFEPGESVIVEPGYFNGDSSAVPDLTGAASNFTGPAGATYTLVDPTAAYGSIAANSTSDCFSAGGDCYQMSVDNPAIRPAAHWDATFDELLSTGGSRTWTLHIGDSFADTPNADIFYAYIENIFHNGITSGCGGGNFCPSNPVTRAQMAVFILKAEHGASYVPPTCTGVFPDVACPGGFAVNWIEQLFAEGITGGCGGGNYCPGNQVTRAQMAVFLLKGEHGSSYLPPACTGLFGDVSCPAGFAVDWIEQLANEAITGGCGGGNYCPNNSVTRGQMAVFLSKTFHLLLYGP